MKYNEEDMYAKEAEIVNEDFIKTIEGFGGFTDEARKKGGNIHKERLENDEEYRANFSALISQYNREGKIKYNNVDYGKNIKKAHDNRNNMKSCFHFKCNIKSNKHCRNSYPKSIKIEC